jgi:hypothetical protein
MRSVAAAAAAGRPAAEWGWAETALPATGGGTAAQVGAPRALESWLRNTPPSVSFEGELSQLEGELFSSPCHI